MEKSLWHLILILLCFQLLSCSKDDDIPLAETAVLIDLDAYNTAQTENLNINSIRLNGDFLIITFSASGCSGESWKVKLIDSGKVEESLPPQRSLVLSLENNEGCEAYITRELAFDISALRVSTNKVWFNFKNFDKGILYEY